MILGAHESAEGGLHRVFERAARDQAHAIQLWTRSSRQWAARPLTSEAIAAFQAASRQSGSPMTAAHASYLINLATDNPAIYERSVATLLQECQRAEQLGIGQVILHPGACAGDREAAIQRTGAALAQVCDTLGGTAQVRVLVEFTAGQGNCLGCSLPEIAAILRQADRARLGVCLDTQHMFAAGIDWPSATGYDALLRDFDRLIGLSRLLAFHLNDSKKPLGSRVDRHDIIGEGLIGLAPFARLITDERLAHLPGYLETPPLPDGQESYAQGLSRLRSLLS